MPDFTCVQIILKYNLNFVYNVALLAIGKYAFADLTLKIGFAICLQT